jgi:hypothetical protein
MCLVQIWHQAWKKFAIPDLVDTESWPWAFTSVCASGVECVKLYASGAPQWSGAKHEDEFLRARALLRFWRVMWLKIIHTCHYVASFSWHTCVYSFHCHHPHYRLWYKKGYANFIWGEFKLCGLWLLGSFTSYVRNFLSVWVHLHGKSPVEAVKCLGCGLFR